MARLQFCGAAREVTGSSHLLEVSGRRILLDCGLFQGRRREAEQKNRGFSFDPQSIDCVVLSHAHTDHCGRLPLLRKQGFHGPIFATPATRDLCAVMLADSAHIQEEDAAYLNRKRAGQGDPPLAPLYTADDARLTVKQFHGLSYNGDFRVTERVSGRFLDAGHMLGSAVVSLRLEEPGRKPLRLVFSGDLGRFRTPILRDPSELPACDYLICESTYGGRSSPSPVDLEERLGQVVLDTHGRGGKIIIPAFSVGRTQVVVYSLARLMRAGRIPRLPVYVDSPLAVNATEVFTMHPDCYDEDAAEFLNGDHDRLGSGMCTFVRSVDESKALHGRREPAVIISASGMCETGRILHHLKNNIESPRNTILIPGFQAQHTLGRRLVERASHVTIFNRSLRVRAEIVVMNGFSAHADRDELLRLAGPAARGCRGVFLVHGEEDQMIALAASLRSSGVATVAMPSQGDVVELDGAS